MPTECFIEQFHENGKRYAKSIYQRYRKHSKTYSKQNRSTEGCSKLKSPESRQLSSGEIGLDIRTHASPKVGQDKVSGGWHAAPVANVLWKPHTIR